MAVFASIVRAEDLVVHAGVIFSEEFCKNFFEKAFGISAPFREGAETLCEAPAFHDGGDVVHGPVVHFRVLITELLFQIAGVEGFFPAASGKYGPHDFFEWN